MSYPGRKGKQDLPASPGAWFDYWSVRSIVGNDIRFSYTDTKNPPHSFLYEGSDLPNDIRSIILEQDFLNKFTGNDLLLVKARPLKIQTLPLSAALFLL